MNRVSALGMLGPSTVARPHAPPSRCGHHPGGLDVAKHRISMFEAFGVDFVAEIARHFPVVVRPHPQMQTSQPQLYAKILSLQGVTVDTQRTPATAMAMASTRTARAPSRAAISAEQTMAAEAPSLIGRIAARVAGIRRYDPGDLRAQVSRLGFAEYEELRLGGAVVFRARKQSIGKDYAIKFLQVDDETVRKALFKRPTTRASVPLANSTRSSMQAYTATKRNSISQCRPMVSGAYCAVGRGVTFMRGLRGRRLARGGSGSAGVLHRRGPRRQEPVPPGGGPSPRTATH